VTNRHTHTHTGKYTHKQYDWTGGAELNTHSLGCSLLSRKETLLCTSPRWPDKRKSSKSWSQMEPMSTHNHRWDARTQHTHTHTHGQRVPIGLHLGPGTTSMLLQFAHLRVWYCVVKSLTLRGIAQWKVLTDTIWHPANEASASPGNWCPRQFKLNYQIRVRRTMTSTLFSLCSDHTLKQPIEMLPPLRNISDFTWTFCFVARYASLSRFWISYIEFDSTSVII